MRRRAHDACALDGRVIYTVAAFVVIPTTAVCVTYRSRETRRERELLFFFEKFIALRVAEFFWRRHVFFGEYI